MKLVWSAVIRPKEPNACILTSAEKLDHIGYFVRSTAREAFVFAGRTLANQKTPPGGRVSVNEANHICNVYADPAGRWCAVCFVTEDYPQRVAFDYLSKLSDAFLKATGGRVDDSADNRAPVGFAAEHSALLGSYQNANEVDKLTKIQNELEQTKVVMHRTIEEALQRGVKIDGLVAKSQDLSGSSKMFFKTAKKQNQCCTYM